MVRSFGNARGVHGVNGGVSVRCVRCIRRSEDGRCMDRELYLVQ